MKKIIHFLGLLAVSSLILFCSNKKNVEGLRITEFMASNDSVFLDNATDAPDWIELYNAGKNVIPLSDYYITSKNNDPKEYQLSGELQPDSYLVIKALGKNNSPEGAPFKLNKKGGELILYSKNETELQRVSYTSQVTNISYALLNERWVYSAPSPGTENTPVDIRTHRSEEVQITFSENDGKVVVKLSSASADDIFYTANGKSPFLEKAILYDAPFELDSTFLVRAALKGENTLLNKEAMRSYVNKKKHTLPILSLSTSPENLWDEKKGLFQGQNYAFRTKEWERAGLIEFIEDSTSKFENVNFKVFGNASRSKPKKSLTIKGEDAMPNWFFSSVKREKIDGFIARASHSKSSKYKNELINEVNLFMKGELMMQEYKPAVLYINGAYWGVYNIMERKNDEFVNNHTPSFPTDLMSANDAQVKAEYGSTESYENMTALVNLASNEQEICQLIEDNFNKASLIDFWCHEIFVNRIDTYNNRLWKDSLRDNKWNFISFDYDICMMKPDSEKLMEKYMRNSDAAGINHLGKFLQCPSFKGQYFRRLLDYMNFGYSTKHIADILDTYETHTSKEFMLDTARWMDLKSKFKSTYSNSKRSLLRFAEQRKTMLLESFEEFGFTDQVVFHIPDSLEDMVFINGFKAAGEVVYFVNMPLEIQINNQDDKNITHWVNEKNEEIKIPQVFIAEKSMYLKPVLSK